MKKFLLSLTVSSLLIGCASNPNEEVIALADLRANHLNSIMPIDVGEYKFMRAHAKSTTVLVDILYGGGSPITPSQFLSNSVKDYCQNPDIKAVLDKGVHYAFTIRDVRARPIAEQVINASSCGL
ncbi:type II secretion system pilot lipoprotein GspS-beta [Thaumasiovibrio sp. DFM-14]|uniref:type II secretion system pilot lipoprotein GspS-beta n=1 Tax=Thaumasiovibrio sp. DFM-14 TaxID=3384792 RepID=UPI0039A13603